MSLSFMPSTVRVVIRDEDSLFPRPASCEVIVVSDSSHGLQGLLDGTMSTYVMQILAERNGTSLKALYARLGRQIHRQIVRLIEAISIG